MYYRYTPLARKAPERTVQAHFLCKGVLTMKTLKENLSFVLVCVAIFAGLAVIAWLAERFLVKERRKLEPARYVAYMGMFAALAGVLMLLEIPLVFIAPNFYKLDFSEIPVLICAFSMGPTAGVICEFLKVVIKLLLKGTTTAFVGDFANFAVGCSMVLPAAIIYNSKRTFKRAVIALVSGGLIMTVFGSLFNAFYLIPAFAALYHMPIEAIIDAARAINASVNSVYTMAALCVAPFNLIKAVAVSVITLPLYKRVKKLIRMDK